MYIVQYRTLISHHLHSLTSRKKIYDNVKLAMIACTHINGYNTVKANFISSALTKVVLVFVKTSSLTG